MHVLTTTVAFQVNKTIGVLEPGEWLLHDLNAFELAAMAPRGTAKVCDNWRGDSQDGPAWWGKGGAPTLVMRSGAFGDLLLLTPVLSSWPWTHNSKVSICCFPHHFPIFQGCDFIEELVSYPLSTNRMNDFGDIISLENTMECDHAQHATDVFAKALGIATPLADYRPIYHVTAAEKEAAQKHIFKGRPTLAVQVKASVSNRDYPLGMWMAALMKLEAQGWGIVILGRKGSTPPFPAQSPFIRDLSALDLSFRESAAVLSLCTAFSGIDSVWAHMCHALDIPAVVLFAAFDWRTRTSKAPKTIALTGVGECAPCNWHMHRGQQFPPGKPCSARQQCVVLADISPDRIVAKVSLLKP